MSDVFEGYERRFRELAAELVRKTSEVGDLDGEPKMLKVTEIITEMDEAEELIRKMDGDARSLQPNVKAVFLAKLREYQSDLSNMKNEMKLIASTKLDQDELLEAGMAESFTAPENSGDKIETTTGGNLNSSGDWVGESIKTMVEGEELEVPLLQDLHQQHVTDSQADANTVHELDDNVSINNRAAVSISRRICRSNWSIVGILAVLILTIFLILYFKISK